MQNAYIYILTNKPNGILYIGVTNDLLRRVYEHKQKLVKGFTQKYELDKLVYYEAHASITDAIHREKCMKDWKRAWKIQRILENNSEWRDLYAELV